MNSVEAYGNYGHKDTIQILQELRSAPIVAVDTETWSLKDRSMIGLALAPSQEYAVWFSEDSPYLYIALGILRNPNVTKIYHNAKFDFDVLEPYGVDETNFEDTEILAYTLNLPQKLYNLATHVGAAVPMKFLEFKFPKDGSVTLWKENPNFILQKCCVDAALTMRCWYALNSKIVESYTIDRNVVTCLRHMEQMGVALNKESVNEYEAELNEQVTYLRQIIQTKGCDPNSNQQVGIALAQRGWKLPYTKGKRQLKVDEKTIKDIPDPLAQIILFYREKAKLWSTYAKPLSGLDRAYTHYNNTRVITGRLSSSDPFNMQNIPYYFRNVFMADDEFWSYDASQIELRAIAYLAQDKAMMEAFESGRDIHRETMDRMGITGKIKDTVMARVLAKTLNFAVTYLAEEETIMENAKKAGIIISPMEATEFKTMYFETYTGIRDYIFSQREQITKHGWVTTLFGRVRKADPLRMKNPRSREAVIRELFNMPVQGTAAEIIKKMMAKASKYDLRIQVHDEIVYDGACPTPTMLEGMAPFKTPLELKVGKSWGDMKKIKM